MKNDLVPYLEDLCSSDTKVTLDGYPSSMEQVHAAQYFAERGCYMADIEQFESGRVKAIDFSYVTLVGEE